MWFADFFRRKREPSGHSDSELLDQLALALAEEVASETGRSKLDVLEQIVETGESLQLNSKSSPQSQRNVPA